jgi:DNA-binding NarL/FixJ family response regulator
MKTARLVAACLFLAPLPAAHGVERLVIVQPGYPGSTAEASSFISDLAAAISQAGGPELEGEYHNQTEDALKAIARDKPRVGIVSLGFYLAQREDLKLEPLLESRPPQRFYLAARKGEAVQPQDLAGKTVVGTPFQEPEFASRILFGGARVEQWKVEASASFSRAVREVARGKAAAVLLNERERQAMGELTAGKDLEVCWQSEELPAALAVSLGPRGPQAESLAKALAGLEKTPEGQSLLSTMGIEGFTPIDREKLSRLEGRFRSASTKGAPAGGR